MVTNNQGVYKSSLTIPTEDGQVHKLAFDKNTKLVFPAVIETEGSYGDSYQGASGKKVMIKGWASGTANGPFVHNFVSSAKSNAKITFRMIRYPKQ